MNTNSANILLVDDEEMVRSLLKKSLEADNHKVTLAVSKKEAFELLSANKFDVLIVDKNLPDGTGLDIIEGARNLGINCEAIIITGYSDTESAIQAVALGVFRYLTKPFDLNSLRIDIKRALEAGKIRQTMAGQAIDLERKNEVLHEALRLAKEADTRRIQSERLAAVEYLAAGVAHEINNPLTLLSMSIPYAIEELTTIVEESMEVTDPARMKQMLEHVLKNMKPTQDALESLMELSSDLHTLGKPDPRQIEPVSIAEPVEAALRLVRHRLKNKAEIVLDVAKDVVVKGHLNRLTQVFTNLLVNAGRAIKKGSKENNKISIRSKIDGKFVVVDICDTGVGIALEHIDKIFDRFFTFSTADKENGSGLGLAITREIVTSHRGSINVSSVLGKGTTFSVRLPILHKQRSISALPVISNSGSGSWIRARRMLLFVDSSESNLALYKKSFGQMHDVTLSSNSRETHQILRDQGDILDAVICEFGTLNVDDMTLCSDQFTRYADLESRFIFIGEPGDLTTAAIEQGLNVLIRPVRPAALLAAIYKIPPRSHANTTPDDAVD